MCSTDVQDVSQHRYQFEFSLNATFKLVVKCKNFSCLFFTAVLVPWRHLLVNWLNYLSLMSHLVIIPSLTSLESTMKRLIKNSIQMQKSLHKWRFSPNIHLCNERGLWVNTWLITSAIQEVVTVNNRKYHCINRHLCISPGDTASSALNSEKSYF